MKAVEAVAAIATGISFQAVSCRLTGKYVDSISLEPTIPGHPRHRKKNQPRDVHRGSPDNGSAAYILRAAEIRFYIFSI